MWRNGMSTVDDSLNNFSTGHKDPSILPLLGALLGNDYTDARLFSNIYCHIHIPKSKKMMVQHRKIEGLLEWLKGQSVEEAIERVI